MEYFDEQNDIIIPDSIFGELIYNKCIIADICKNPNNRKYKWLLLRRQIRFFYLWMKNK